VSRRKARRGVLRRPFAGDNAAVLPSTAELERRVAELLVRWRVPPGPPVAVHWNQRLLSTAGRAFGHAGRIELSPALLAKSPDALEAVLVHEAAHVAVHRLFGPRVAPHGRHWRALMRLCGLPPEVTHDLPVGRRRRARFLYLRLCNACGDRRIGRSVRYGDCGCGAGDRFLVLRAPAAPAGLAMLRALPLAEVRRRCIMAGPG
jgi:predicted SprT family Zn-dependent metalloprotease